MERARELEEQAARAKRMLDEIDALIEEDNSKMLDTDIMRARKDYSVEWRACVDLARKLSAQAPKEQPRSEGKLEALRSNVVRLTG